MLTISGHVLVTVLAALTSGLTIETRTPDAHCPDVAATRKAADERLGVLDVAGQGRWKAVYTMVYAPGTADGNRVHLELFDPQGQRRLERDLPLRGESCAAMAQVLVVVLERYFRDLGSASDPIEPAPRDTPAPTTATPAAVDRRPAAPTSPADANRFVASLTLGPAFLSPPAAAAIALEGRLWLAPWAHVSLGTAWSPVRMEQHVGPAGGVARANFLPVRASLGFGWRFESGYVHLGPDVLVSFDQASTSGVAVPSQNWRMVIGAGAAAGAFFWLRKPWALSIGGAVDATLPLAASQFVVEQEEVLTQKWIQGFMSIGLAYVTLP
jgi:hypothetical protein